MTLSRRRFLCALPTVTPGLSIAIQLHDWTRRGTAATAARFQPNAFLRIDANGVVTLWCIRLEMGQGVRTVLPMVLAEELEVDWAEIQVEQAEPGTQFAGITLHTSGSGSSSGTFRVLRTAGAAARELLVAAAASAWDVDVSSCHASRGAVTHAPTGRKMTYGSLASAAARLPVPQAPRLKDAKAFKLLGTPVRRVDGPAIVAGRATYGLDVRVPGMLFATIERAPTLGGSLIRFDGSEALKLTGVRQVLPVTAGIHPGVAVVAEDTWTALRARRALRIEWDLGPCRDFDSEQYLRQLPDACERADFVVRHEGDALGAIAVRARRLDATYVFPFQAHAPLETMNCTADVREHAAELWVPTQTDRRTLEQVAKVTGFPRDAITLHPVMMGGGFGRRLFSDYAAEAAQIAKVIGRPVQVVWTRQDDMRHGFFQPATAERFTAGIDANGRIVGLVHKTTASDLTIYDIHSGRNIWTSRPEAKEPDHYSVAQDPWGAFDTPYSFGALRVDCADVTSPVPVGPWRAVAYPSTVFARESFLDELAHLLGKDPIALRLELLPRDIIRIGSLVIDRARLARVLKAVAARPEWTASLTPAPGWRRGRGVAANVYHGRSYLAMLADVSVREDGSELRIERVMTIVDVGIALNPLALRAQTESGIAWGLSATLFGKMNFARGAAVESSFRDFRVLRMREMPAVETVILDSGASPGGYGEHPVPLVAPAVANAIFAATGRRIRSLPITPEKLKG